MSTCTSSVCARVNSEVKEREGFYDSANVTGIPQVKIKVKKTSTFITPVVAMLSNCSSPNIPQAQLSSLLMTSRSHFLPFYLFFIHIFFATKRSHVHLVYSGMINSSCNGYRRLWLLFPFWVPQVRSLLSCIQVATDNNSSRTETEGSAMFAGRADSLQIFFKLFFNGGNIIALMDEELH